MTDQASREMVRTFITTIAAQAKAALKGVDKPGYLQMSRLHPKGEKLVPSRYGLDDTERMIKDAIADSGAGHNVYIEGRTIREDAACGNGRGELKDTAYVFALVVDSDADTGKGWKPNETASPSMVVETSPGNFQYWFFFGNAIAADIGQQLGNGLRAVTRADQDTGVITQPYRVAGTINYPSKKKCKRGRITVPTLLVDFNPEALWTPELIEKTFPRPTATGNGCPAGNGVQPDEGDIPPDTMQVIRAGAAEGLRSHAFWNVMVVVKQRGFDVDAVVTLLEQYPNGIAFKYAGRLRHEVERAYNKISSQQPEAPQDAELQSVRASAVTMRSIDWLWRNRFALHKLGLLVGLPDEGKGQVLSYIAARVTSESDKAWPCNEGQAPLGNVILLTVEDDFDDTVVPRLKAAGADLDRVEIVKMVNEKGSERMFSLVSDLELLRRKIDEVGDVVLVLIDPISAYLGVRQIDSFRTNDVRAVLAPLVALAAEKNVAIIGVMHFNKKLDITNVMLRISDSLAYGATARHVYGVIDDAENKRKLVVRGKNNLVPSDQSNKALAYRFGVCEVGTDPRNNKPINAPYVVWEPNYIDVTASEAMQAALDNKSPVARDEAKKFLQTLLAKSPMAVKEIEDAAEGNGIAWR